MSRREARAESRGDPLGDGSLGRSFSKLALQGTPVDAKPSCRLRDVLITIGQDSVDMFPFGLGERGDGDLLVRLGGFHFRAPTFERAEDIVRIGRLWKKISGAKFDRIDRGSDTSKS